MFVAIVALGVAAASALAAPDMKADPVNSGHSPEQLELALEMIGPQDPAIVAGFIESCGNLRSQGIETEPCVELLREAGVDR